MKFDQVINPPWNLEAIRDGDGKHKSLFENQGTVRLFFYGKKIRNGNGAMFLLF